MEHHPPYELLPLRDVPPGRLVGIPGDPEACLAMTVQPVGSDSHPGLVILSGGRRFDLMEGAALSRHKVLLYPDARVILPCDPTKLWVDTPWVMEPYGSIAFVENQLHLIGRLGSPAKRRLRRFCALNGGAISEGGNTLYRTWFTHWSVAIRDSNGVWQPVLDVEAEPPSDD